QWLDSYWLQTNMRPQILFENSILSTLSADSKMVYAVEDLPIPPPQNLLVPANPWNPVPANNWGQEVTKAINCNKLQGFELAKGGKLAWEIGGPDEKDPRLVDTYFLGSPLPLNGRLHVLSEKMQELRLLTLDPATGKVLNL